MTFISGGGLSNLFLLIAWQAVSTAIIPTYKHARDHSKAYKVKIKSTLIGRTPSPEARGDHSFQNCNASEARTRRHTSLGPMTTTTMHGFHGYALVNIRDKWPTAKITAAIRQHLYLRETLDIGVEVINNISKKKKTDA